MLKLLLVDDEKGITDGLKEFFEHRKFTVKTANSGEEALKLVRNDNFNIIFLDIRMKGIDGIETLKQIKEIDKNAKVIMLTVHGEKEMIDKAKELGADEYIKKPFQLDYLEEVVLKKVRELLRENT